MNMILYHVLYSQFAKILTVYALQDKVDVNFPSHEKTLICHQLRPGLLDMAYNFES